jgi:virginiamycin B lyase
MTTATLNAPSDPAPTLTYNGAWIGGDSGSAPITANVPANPSVKPGVGQVVPIPLVTEYAIATANATPIDLTRGPDGALWFTEEFGHKVGRVTMAGVSTEFAVPGSSAPGAQSLPWAITAGADGNLWFSDVATFDEAIDYITTSGTVTRHSIKSGSNTRSLFSMVSGPDGNLWAVDAGGNQIVR